MANEKNLISLKDRTEDERKEIASKGGKKSGEVRREKIELKKRLEILLKQKDMFGNTGEDKICTGLILSAQKGNVKAFELINNLVSEGISD